MWADRQYNNQRFYQAVDNLDPASALVASFNTTVFTVLDIVIPDTNEEIDLAALTFGMSCAYQGTSSVSTHLGGLLKNNRANRKVLNKVNSFSLKVSKSALSRNNGKVETSLYRVVGPDELSDVQKIKGFRNLGSAEGKYFTTSAKDVASYAKQAVNAFDDPPYTLVKTKAPKSIFNGLEPASVERGIPAWVIPEDRLQNLVPTIMDSMPIP